jgi:hypothetical protein
MTPAGKPRSKLASFALAAAMTLGLAPGLAASAAVDPLPVQQGEGTVPRPFENLDGSRAVRYYVPRLSTRRRRRGASRVTRATRACFSYKQPNRFLRRSVIKAMLAGRGPLAEQSRQPRNLRYDGGKLVKTTVRSVYGTLQKLWFEARRQAWVDTRLLAAADRALTYQHVEGAEVLS